MGSWSNQPQCTADAPGPGEAEDGAAASRLRVVSAAAAGGRRHSRAARAAAVCCACPSRQRPRTRISTCHAALIVPRALLAVEAAHGDASLSGTLYALPPPPPPPPPLALRPTRVGCALNRCRAPAHTPHRTATDRRQAPPPPPRQLINRLPYAVGWKQHASVAASGVLQPDERAPFHWPLPQAPRLLAVCFLPPRVDATTALASSDWSFAFPLTDVGDLTVVARLPDSRQKLFVNIDVQASKAAMRVVFSAVDEAVPPYRIDNLSPYALVVHQSTCAQPLVHLSCHCVAGLRRCGAHAGVSSSRSRAS